MLLATPEVLTPRPEQPCLTHIKSGFNWSSSPKPERTCEAYKEPADVLGPDAPPTHRSSDDRSPSFDAITSGKSPIGVEGIKISLLP